MPGYYETDRAASEYLLFHYGAEADVMPWAFGPRDALQFPARIVRDGLLRERLPVRVRALDLGCAVGRSSFELARSAEEVVGIDLSGRFIAAAREMQATGEIRYRLGEEGGIFREARVRVPEGVDAGRVRFEVGDALRLPPDLGGFDVVLAANLVDRVQRPRELLGAMGRLVRPGGQLILTSPYTWLEEYTAQEEWLCASGRPTSEVLAGFLPGFRLERRLDVPFVIREHARKFQWSVAELTTWLRSD